MQCIEIELCRSRKTGDMRLRYDRIRVQRSVARERGAPSNSQNSSLYDVNVILNLVNSLWNLFIKGYTIKIWMSRR